MKILVTGGSGFIGSNSCPFLAFRHPDDEVSNLDKLTYAANPQSLSDVAANPHYHFVRGDICDPLAVDNFVSSGIELIVHFAAESHVDRSLDDPEAFLKTNILAPIFSLKPPKISNCFHHISTDEVYGALPSIHRSNLAKPLPMIPALPIRPPKPLLIILLWPIIILSDYR